MQSVKEKTANAAASAKKAGMEKTKASVDQKGDKMNTRDPMEKTATDECNQEKGHAATTGGVTGHAATEKQGEKQVNAAERGRAATTGGVTGHQPTGGYGSGV